MKQAIRQRGPRFGPSERTPQVLASGRLTEGPMLEALERRLSEMSGVHVLAVSSGAAALDIAMEVARVAFETPHDQVGVPVVGHWTDLASVVRAGLRPVWIPVDDEGQARTPDRMVSLWVNIGGNRKRPNAAFSGAVIADVSHATGDPSALALGDMAVASMFATKVLTAGEGGLIGTRQDALVPLIRSMRDSGRDTTAPRTGFEPYVHFGSDRRMPELSAALALDSLDTLEYRVGQRRAIFSRYDLGLALAQRGLRFPYMVDTRPGLYKALVACESSKQAESLRAWLLQHDIVTPSGVFDLALPDMGPGLAPDCDPTTLATGRSWASSHVALPFHETMPAEEVDAVVAALSTWR